MVMSIDVGCIGVSGCLEHGGEYKNCCGAIYIVDGDEEDDEVEIEEDEYEEFEDE